MKLIAVIVSDSHGHYANLQEAANRHPDASLLIHCGDGVSDLRNIVDTNMVLQGVSGNCDTDSSYPEWLLLTTPAGNLFITHGHLFNVKTTLDSLAADALEKNAAAVCYGHTHMQRLNRYLIPLFNPGSIASGEYGLLYLDSGPVFRSSLL